MSKKKYIYREWTHSGKMREERKSLAGGSSGKTARGCKFCSWSEVGADRVRFASDFLLAKDRVQGLI